jgi:hypothetical protein
MRWLLGVSLLAGLIVAPSSAKAQRGGSGAHAGGFAAPRMSGGFGSSAHFSSGPGFAPRSFNAPRYNWSAPARTMGNYQNRAPYGNWRTSQGSNGYRRSPYPSYGYRQPYRPYYNARSTYLVPGFLNPYWGYGDGYGYDADDYAGDQSAQNGGNYEADAAPYDNDQAPGMTYQAQDVPPPPPGSPDPLPQAAITLVFKDGHSQQVHNYAVTKTTLYILDDAASGRRPEIPLSTIDVAATERANQEAGVDFAVPATAN